MSHYTDAALDAMEAQINAANGAATDSRLSLIAALREARAERCTNPLRSEIPCDSLVRENDALRKERDEANAELKSYAEDQTSTEIYKSLIRQRNKAERALDAVRAVIARMRDWNGVPHGATKPTAAEVIDEIAAALSPKETETK